MALSMGTTTLAKEGNNGNLGNGNNGNHNGNKPDVVTLLETSC